jgi:ferredoxin-nitrate reductase
LRARAAKPAQQTRISHCGLCCAKHLRRGAPLAFHNLISKAGRSFAAGMSHSLDHRASYGETICPYCGVGCRLWAEVGYGKVLRVKAVADAPANRGGICAKGATLDQTVAVHDRLVQPLLRSSRHHELAPASWDAALDALARRLAKVIDRFGPDRVAFYGSGQLDSAAVYCAVKLFKGRLGTNNTDSNSRLCMATAVAAYRSSLGSDGPPTCYDDIELAETIFIAGSNMADAHPVTFDRIKAARKANPALKLIVADPRRTATAEQADLHLAVRPGTDIALFNALAATIWRQGGSDAQFIREHCRGGDDYLAAISQLHVDRLCEECGIGKDQVELAARWLVAGRPWLSFFCMGLGQSTVGMWKINSLINLHLLTGSIARPGCGPFSLTGQPNAMGGREIGLLSHQLPGYRFVENAEHRAEVERYWGCPVGTISDRPGLTAVEMFRGLETGRLKAIWIAATNPAVSLPDLHHIHRALSKAELVVVQDSFHPTETTRRADIVLPAASWGEREWVSTNSERMVAYSQKLVEPPGAALPDWKILCLAAQRLGFDGFDFSNAGQVWDEWIGLTAGRICDMTGMSHARLKQVRNLQWPCSSGEHPGTPRLYQDRRFAHADGKAVFLFRESSPPKEAADHEFPLVLTTGRVYSHWHTLTRTAKARQLWRRESEPQAELHPDLARKLGVVSGDFVQITSRRGTVQVKAAVTDRVAPDLLFLPMHWGDQFSPGNAVNYLTISAIGRVAKQPELKHCAVHVEKAHVETDERRDTARSPRLVPFRISTS